MAGLGTKGGGGAMEALKAAISAVAARRATPSAAPLGRVLGMFTPPTVWVVETVTGLFLLKKMQHVQVQHRVQSTVKVGTQLVPLLVELTLFRARVIGLPGARAQALAQG